MSDWLLALVGTEAGARLALVLALTAAFLHAVFGALQKGRHDPWLSRGAIDAWLVVLSLPLALLTLDRVEPTYLPILAGCIVIHFVYKIGVAAAFSRGAYTVVYPVVRGSNPVFAVFGAWLLFGETFTPVQLLGVAVLVAGILGLAVYNLRHLTLQRETLVPALAMAVGTGALVAIYTTYDAYGIRTAADPLAFLAWFFLVTAFDMPIIAALRWRRMEVRPALRPLLLRGLIGAVIAYGSFGSIMLATLLDKVGEAAVLRETSTVFAALIGWLVLGDTVGPRRLALMVLIALGAVIVEIGS